MKRRTLIALSIAAGFALPLSVQAADDKAKSSGSTATPSASQGASGSASTGGSADSSGAAKMFEQLDKNKDGSISKEEAKGTPHEKDFAKLDKNNDGKLSKQEHAAAAEHTKDKAATGGTSGGSTSGSSASGSSASGTSGSGSTSGAPAPSQPKSKY